MKRLIWKEVIRLQLLGGKNWCRAWTQNTFWVKGAIPGHQRKLKHAACAAHSLNCLEENISIFLINTRVSGTRQWQQRFVLGSPIELHTTTQPWHLLEYIGAVNSMILDNCEHYLENIPCGLWVFENTSWGRDLSPPTVYMWQRAYPHTYNPALIAHNPIRSEKNTLDTTKGSTCSLHTSFHR